MSRHVAAMVYSRRVGTMLRKAVLAYFAERANDDGTMVWASKQTIADEIECSKQAVIKTVKQFVAEGLLIESGHRRTQGGYTVVYDISLPVLAALPDAKNEEKESTGFTGENMDRSTGFTPTSQPQIKKESTGFTQTVLEPSMNLVAKATMRARELKPNIELPDWIPLDAWQGWLAMRKAKRAPPTARAIELAINELDKLRRDGHDPGAVLDQSTMKNWTGLFPMKDENHGHASRQPHLEPGIRGTRPNPLVDAYADACRAVEAEERAAANLESGQGTWLALPPIGAS